jgi:hypothetical protein
MGHFVFLSIFLFLRNIVAPQALKIAVNFRGCNTAKRSIFAMESTRNHPEMAVSPPHKIFLSSHPAMQNAARVRS